MQRTPTCPNCCKTYAYKENNKNSKPVCQTTPLLLECGHTFCETCVTKLAKLQKTRILCPTCQVETVLETEGEGGVKKLPLNIYVLGVLLYNKIAHLYSDGTDKPAATIPATLPKHDSLSSTSSTTPGSPTQKCDECCSAAAVYQCNRCECVLCAKCFEEVHASLRILRQHQPIPLVQASSSVVCSVHDGKPLEFYDEDEEKALCAHCAIMGQQKGHRITTVQEASKDLEEQLLLALSNAKKVLENMEKSDQTVWKTLPIVKIEVGQLAHETREHFQTLHASLQCRELELIKDLTAKGSEHDDLDQLHAVLTQRIQDAKKIIKEGENALQNPCSLVALGKEMMSKLSDIQEMPCCVVPSLDRQDPVLVSFPDGAQSSFMGYGSVEVNQTPRFELRKLNEVTEKEIDDTVAELQRMENIILSDSENQEEEETLESAEEHDHGDFQTAQSLAARNLLSLPLRYELVFVTHIKDPCDFKIQRLADAERLEMIMEGINKYCQGPVDYMDRILSPRVGDLCCAQYSMDNLWYRACIINITEKVTLDGTGVPVPIVEVQYIDYGNQETIPATRLRRLHSEFSEIPGLAVSCSLMDIVPLRKMEKWPVKSVRVFGSLCGDKPLLMSVFNRSGGKLFCDLKSPEDEPTQDDDRPASVRDTLVFLEVACFLSSASKPSLDVPLTPSKVFKDPSLPGTEELVDVVVTHGTEPDNFFVQIMGQSDDLCQLMDDLSTIYTEPNHDAWKILWPYKGLTCAARFSEDHSWYRALITFVTDDDEVDVTYVDFGNSEKLPFSEIRKLPDHNLQLPKQAINCSLVDIKPSPSQEWSSEAKAFFLECVAEKAFVLQVKGHSDNGCLSVLMFDTSTGEAVCLNELLVAKKYADSADLGIVRSQQELFKVIAAAEAGNHTESNVSVETQETEESLSTQPSGSDMSSTLLEETASMALTASGTKQDARDRSEGDQTDTTLGNSTAPAENKTWGDIMEDESGIEEKDLVQERLVQELLQEQLVQVDKNVDLQEDEVIIEEETTPSEEMIVPEEAPAAVVESDEESVEIKLSKRFLHQYQPPEFPTKRKSLVSVTFVNEDGFVFAQEVKEGDKTLIRLMDALAQRYSDVDKNDLIERSSDLQEGDPVCAQFSQDQMWYRAIVCSVMDEKNVVVKYVDFGNADIVPIENLRVMDHAFMEPPVQCLTLTLHGIQLATQDGKYSSEVLQALAVAVIGQECNITIKGSKVSGKPLSVRLVLTSGQDVGNELLNKGLAKLKTPQPSPSSSTSKLRKPKHSSKKPKETSEVGKIRRPLMGQSHLKSALHPSELPPPGTRFDVTVTQVDRPDCLYFQRVPPYAGEEALSEDADPTSHVASLHLMELEELSSKINEPNYFEKTPSVNKAWAGMLCCGKYIMDGMWYRAEVHEVISEDPLTVKVVYVDYGTNEILQGNRLKAFPVDLLSLPVQATRCHIWGLCPPDEPSEPVYEGTEWPMKSMEALLEIVAGKKLIATIKDPVPPICVELHERQFNEDKSFTDVSVGEILAAKGLAKLSPEESGDFTTAEESPEVEIEEEVPVSLTEECFHHIEIPELPSYASSAPKLHKPVSIDSVLSTTIGFTGPKLLTPEQFSSTSLLSSTISSPLAYLGLTKIDGQSMTASTPPQTIRSDSLQASITDNRLQERVTPTVPDTELTEQVQVADIIENPGTPVLVNDNARESSV